MIYMQILRYILVGNAVNKNLEITFERMLAKVEEIGIRWTKMFVTFIKPQRKQQKKIHMANKL